MRRSLLAAAAAVLALAGCGGHTTAHPHAAAAAPERCSPADMAMQCVHPGAMLNKPTVAPIVAFGADFAWTKPSPAWLRGTGARFAAGYYSTDPTKNLTAGWANAYHAAGLATLGVWETTATRALGGYPAGRWDAQQAARQAAMAGEPASRPIYFAVDFDETPSQASAVAAYFQGANSILGAARTGGYGGYWTVKRLLDAGLIRYAWQTSAWSGGAWDTRAQLQQYGYLPTLDWDRAMTGDYGQWPYVPPTPPPAPAKRWSSVEVQAQGALNGRATLTVKNGRWTVAGAGSWRARSLPYDTKPLGGGR